MIEESVYIDDIIIEVKPLTVNNVNLGISDFSSAFYGAEENKQNSIKEKSIQPEKSKSVEAKKSKTNIQAELPCPITEKKVTRQSKSKPKLDDKKILDIIADRESTLILEEQAPDLSAKSSLLENDLSNLESSTPDVKKQESKTKSQASVGLPQWKPRQR